MLSWLTLGSYRFFFGLSFSCVCVIAGCGNLIGFGDYSVAGESGGTSAAGSGNVAGDRIDGDNGGHETSDGGTSGAPDADSGAAGVSGAGDGGAANGGAAGASTAGTSGTLGTSGAPGNSGSAGTGGAPAACPGGCDDTNDCTVDSCVSGACAHVPLATGTACGVARSCDAQALCVRCRDSAAGTGQDVGCSPTAPICLGTGLDAACAGCLNATDCNDGNECTTEACTGGKCVFATVAAGTSCAAGVCNGSASAEKCVACADNASGATQDSGCSSAKPVCDPSGTPTCYQCLNNADCASDNLTCTVETCTNHVCSHPVNDSLCPASNDVCKPNKCDAAVAGGCKSVDISTSKVVIALGSTQGNGGFELAGANNSAAGWADIGGFRMIYNCTPSGAGCAGTNGKTVTQATGGDFLAWLGGTTAASVTGIDHLIGLPLGTVKLQVIADVNFQTKSTAAANNDTFAIRLLDAAKSPVGSALYAASNANAQTGALRNWTANGINVTVDVSAYAAAHVGEDSYISFSSSVDGSLTSDFFIDNVRLNAIVCQ